MHANVVEASWQALVDALVYVLPVAGRAAARSGCRPGHSVERQCRADATGQNRPPDGVAFVAIDGARTAASSGPGRSRTTRSARRTSPAGRGRWPTSGCSRRSCRRRWSRSAATTPTTRAELGNAVPDEPMIFLKPSTSVIGPSAPIRLPAVVDRVDYEGELAVVIGRPCRDVQAENAASVILGYTVANDVTARDQQRADVQFTRGKGYDTFCPLGPWIETELDPADLRVDAPSWTARSMQDGRTADMVFAVGEIIEFVSGIMTLLPGDVLLTGTPAGVGPMVAGQTVSVTVEGIGTLTNPVARGAERPDRSAPTRPRQSGDAIQGGRCHDTDSSACQPARPVRARFCPSPTGTPHVGLARTALFNWAFARHHGGTFVFRIEDTDAARDSEESYLAILDALTWLGPGLGRGPERRRPARARTGRASAATIYREVAAELLAAGHLYESYSTAEEVDGPAPGRRPRPEARLRQLRPHPDPRADRGRRRAAGRRPGAAAADAGPRHHLRRPGPRRDHFPAGSVPDFVLVRGNGEPLYTLVNPVDDALMGITHVLRGEDLLPSTPRQIALYEALIDIGRARAGPAVRAPAVRHRRGQPQALQARPAVEPVPVPRRRVHPRGHGQLSGAARLVARRTTGTSSPRPRWSRRSTCRRSPATRRGSTGKKAEAINGAHIRLLRAGRLRRPAGPYLQSPAARLPAEPVGRRSWRCSRAAAPLVQERSALLSDAARDAAVPVRRRRGVRRGPGGCGQGAPGARRRAGPRGRPIAASTTLPELDARPRSRRR